MPRLLKYRENTESKRSLIVNWLRSTRVAGLKRFGIRVDGVIDNVCVDGRFEAKVERQALDALGTF